MTETCGCACAQDTGVSRRKMMLRLGAGMTAAGAALMGVPILGFVLSAFTRPTHAQEWVSIGPIEQFPAEQTRLVVYQNPATRPWDGDTAHVPCWVRRIDEQRFQVFAINCTHLGCPVRWFPESKLFMCPCHGGAFYEDGSHASGPPPRGLFEYQHKIEDGHLMVMGGYLPTLAEPL
ncbi:MAG TPA: Rieske (2Fe-2S) protein [Vicinamibacterales bacterium]|nr:Rieske (2Fe-2S) protein [Vicinamibacterales bacterium]